MHGAWGMGNKAVEDGGESGSSQRKKDESWKILFFHCFSNISTSLCVLSFGDR